MFRDPILNKLYKIHGPHKFEDKSHLLYEELVENIIGSNYLVRLPILYLIGF